MNNKWKAVPEFCNLLTMMENNQKTTAIAAGNMGEESEEAAACVHDENGSDWSTNDTSRGWMTTLLMWRRWMNHPLGYQSTIQLSIVIT